MGTTLIIKGADFSSVAIGHVDIPKEISEEAKKWITASGNSTMSSEQKMAVDEFINATSELKGKIYKMYIPMIANNISNSLVNYVTLTNDTPEGFGDCVEYSDGGIKSKCSSSVIKRITMDEQVASNNLSIFVCHTKDIEPIQSGSIIFPIVGFGTTTTGRAIYYAIQTASVFKPMFDINNKIAGNTAYHTADNSAKRLSRGVRGVIAGETSYTSLCNDGNFKTMSYPDGITHKSYDTLSVMTSPNMAAFSSNSTPYGMVVIGKQMTNEEANILKMATESLMNAFVE